MKIANINRFIQYLRTAFDALQVEIAMEQIEQIAMVVHSAMESSRRRYHCSDHALYMCEGMAPRQVLAAVFHDIVYYQLDDGFPARVTHLLNPLVGRQGNDLILRKTAGDDPDMQLCLEIFDFIPGQTLPLFRGMNEFMSAAVAVRMLQPFLAPADLIAVVACIEATIPFRAPEPDGRDNIQVLAERVRQQGIKRLGLTDGPALDAFVDATMVGAIQITNRDVASFAEPNPGRFVSGTWLLIEESNAPLSAVGVYTLQDYREALSRMHNFLESLQAPRVFHQYANFPSAAEYAEMTAAAAANIAFTVAFLRLKILSIVIIEAMARDTGGNCPVSMFLGDIRSNAGMPERVEDYLPQGPSPAGLDAQLLQMLEKGRPEDASNDLAVSPLTAFIYRSLGPQGCDAALAASRRMLIGEMSTRDFLMTLNPSMLRTIIDACARIAISRKDRLNQLRAALADG
ncbi:hypothetical protein [Rhodoferax sp. GW822-FHT02A01]|uniref:hypothetical protein n=1 Tax=Rhodoferax sp. GW822-FHT02A01 TaxID=3141537 RepID=UPI00315D24B0